MNKSSPAKRQRGGFVIGLVIGLLIGLALALGVALYVTKAPNPFVNKVPLRTPAQDAAEVERNRNWDPNGALAGKNPAPTGTRGSGVVTAPTAGSLPPASTGAAPQGAASSIAMRPPATRDLSAIDRALSAAQTDRASQPSSSTTGVDPFFYFVQAGAFSRSEDAEQQRAKLAMLGVESKLTEREQGGRTVFRVRAGPFDRKGDADAAKGKLGDAGVESSLVRVQR